MSFGFQPSSTCTILYAEVRSAKHAENLCGRLEQRADAEMRRCGWCEGESTFASHTQSVAKYYWKDHATA